MATFNKTYFFTEALAIKTINLRTDTLAVALSNESSVDASANLLSDITQIAYTNLSSRIITTTGDSSAGGVYKLVLADLVLTATGPVAPFRLICIYDTTAALNPLIGYIDYGSSVTLATGSVFTINFDQTNGFLTIG